jgi:hypothetical protein
MNGKAIYEYLSEHVHHGWSIVLWMYFGHSSVKKGESRAWGASFGPFVRNKRNNIRDLFSMRYQSEPSCMYNGAHTGTYYKLRTPYIYIVIYLLLAMTRSTTIRASEDKYAA